MTETEWLELSRRMAFASHRLVGWIFWDPVGIANYAALGVPDGAGYYIATRAGCRWRRRGTTRSWRPSARSTRTSSGSALDLCRAHTTFEAAAGARDAAVVEGLGLYVPEIRDGLAELAAPLWDAADALSPAARVLFAAHREWPRPADPVLSAWLAVNCIREWRGDTHWALQITDGLSTTAAGVLDGAWRSYEDGWLPRSRGADDEAIAAAVAELEQRGLAEGGRVDAAGVEHRQRLEDRLDELTVVPWRLLGADRCRRFLDLVEPVGDRLMARVDATAGPNWMPAGRVRPERAR